MVESFLTGYIRTRNQQTADERAFLKRLADEAQSPDALYVGCSDSRIIPERLTATTPGRLFVVRNVANLVPPLANADTSVSAAIEYAVEYLEVPHVIVCGHYGCGGVRAAMDGLDKLAELSELRKWIAGVTLDERELAVATSRDPWRAAVERNVLGQLENLSSFPAVRDRLASGKLQVHGWAYDMGVQSLWVYDATHGMFVEASELGTT